MVVVVAGGGGFVTKLKGDLEVIVASTFPFPSYHKHLSYGDNQPIEMQHYDVGTR